MTSPYREPDELPEIPVRRWRWLRDNTGPICVMLAGFALAGTLFGGAFGKCARPVPPESCFETAEIIGKTESRRMCVPHAHMLLEKLSNGGVLVSCVCGADADGGR